MFPSFQRFVEYEIDIEPPSLVSRIVSVREQIAGEWVSDLQTLRDVNEMILDAYYKAQDEQRSSKENVTATTTTTDSVNATTRANDDLDSVPDPSSSSSSDAAERKAYDRGAMMVLGNHIVSDGGTASSPYRKSSFDLLGLLATQESVHRVLHEYREEERGLSFVWLRDFYVARLASHFDGAQPYGRADDFLGELLLQAPSMKQLDDESSSAGGDVIGLIDPHRIAEDIITMRSVVAQEWRDTITEVLQTDHAELRKSILTVQMDRRLDETSQYVEEQTSFYEQGFQ